MTAKTARRFLECNGHKLTIHEMNGTGKAMLKRAKIAKHVILNERRNNEILSV